MKTIMFLIVMVLTLFVSSVDAAPLVKIEITDAINKKAVCNDGSPGVYYLRNGFGSGVNRWVITLAGGFPCDLPVCDGTSNGTASTITEKGLLSDDAISNPDFYNANTVFVHNCSGDLWSGNKLQTAGSRPTQFRGRNIFRNVIAELMAKSGNNLLSPGTEILLAGHSSGGIGVMVHLDWLARKLPHAKVRGLNDSGWIPEKSTKSSVRGFEEAFVRVIPLWKGKADVDCWRANRAQKGKCYLSSAYPYITTPLFIAESQWDWIFVIEGPADPGADEFARAVRDSLVPVQAAWSPRVVTHVMSTRPGFTTYKIGTVTFKDTLGNWFFDRPGIVKAVKK